jgi:hypothetical protein
MLLGCPFSDDCHLEFRPNNAGILFLGLYYVGFVYIFRYVDRLLGQYFKLPPQLEKFYLGKILGMISRDYMPPWLSLILVIAFMYVWIVLYVVTKLVSGTVAIPLLCFALNCVTAAVVLPKLKTQIADTKKYEGSKMTASVLMWRLFFVVQLLFPVVMFVLFTLFNFSDVALIPTATVCIAVSAVGMVYGWMHGRKARLAAAAAAKTPTGQPYVPPPERRAQNLRPKQRAMLEAQLAAKAKKKAAANPVPTDTKAATEEKNYFAPKPKPAEPGAKERFGIQELPSKTAK